VLPNEATEWEGRIVGGHRAGSGQFPYQISLRNAANSHFCGGSIINRRWVLTAGHCTHGRSTGNTRVVVGTHLLNSGGTSYTSSSIVVHPQYNTNTLANDISLVQTASAMTFNNLAQPMGLASGYTGSGVTTTVSGWGQTSVCNLSK
jgi:trypsin